MTHADVIWFKYRCDILTMSGGYNSANLKTYMVAQAFVVFLTHCPDVFTNYKWLLIIESSLAYHMTIAITDPFKHKHCGLDIFAIWLRGRN